MTNEAKMRQYGSTATDFICADGTGIEKGALLMLTDPRTVALSTGDEDYFVGIAGREKIASDGRVRIAVYTDGIFDIMCSGAVTAGQAVATFSSTGGSNFITVATATAIGNKTVGIALEDSAAGTPELIQIQLNPGCNNTAY